MDIDSLLELEFNLPKDGAGYLYDVSPRTFTATGDKDQVQHEFDAENPEFGRVVLIIEDGTLVARAYTGIDGGTPLPEFLLAFTQETRDELRKDLEENERLVTYVLVDHTEQEITEEGILCRWAERAAEAAYEILRHRKLTELIPTLVISSAGGNLPFQSKGTIAGYEYYFRYRYGNATLGIYETGTLTSGTINGIIAQTRVVKGDRWDGSLTDTEFHEVFVELVNLIPSAALRWDYPFTNEQQEEETIHVHAATEEDAWHGAVNHLEQMMREKRPGLSARFLPHSRKHGAKHSGAVRLEKFCESLNLPLA